MTASAARRYSSRRKLLATREPPDRLRVRNLVTPRDTPRKISVTLEDMRGGVYHRGVLALRENGGGDGPDTHEDARVSLGGASGSGTPAS